MPFVKGQSGNPGGRPKAQQALIESAREHTVKSIQVLASALSDEDARVRIKAAEVLLDRGWGKPAQSLAVTGADEGPLLLHTIERRIIDPAA